MKRQLQLNDYLVIGIIVLFIVGNVYSCSRSSDKAQQQEIEKAYTEGYEAGYYDGENGNPYNDVR